MWKRLMEGSWHTPHQHQLLATGGMTYYFVYFPGDGSEVQRGKRPAKVTQLHTVVPGRGGPLEQIQIPKVRISLIVAAVLGGLGRHVESGTGKTRKPSQLQLQARFCSGWAHSDPVGEPR